MEAYLLLANFKNPFLTMTVWRFKHFKKYVQLKTRNVENYFISYLLDVSVGDLFQQNQGMTIIGRITRVNELTAVYYTLSPVNCWPDPAHNRLNMRNNCSRDKGGREQKRSKITWFVMPARNMLLLSNSLIIAQDSRGCSSLTQP